MLKELQKSLKLFSRLIGLVKELQLDENDNKKIELKENDKKETVKERKKH